MDAWTPHTTPTKAADLLKDIFRWQAKYQPTYATIQAVQYDRDSPPATDETRLPFPTDTVNEDGARGVETRQGVDQWMAVWANVFAYHLSTTNHRTTGAWLLKQVEEHPLLHPIPTISDDQDETTQNSIHWFHRDWDTFTQDLHVLWWRLGTTTGHTPITRALCPRCKQGVLQSNPTDKGIIDVARCTQCGLTIDYHHEEAAASFRAALRDPNINPTYHLPIEDVKVIWPRIKAGTLSKWVERGHIRKCDGNYNLADINQRMWDRT